jgi:hypothetical protein
MSPLATKAELIAVDIKVEAVDLALSLSFPKNSVRSALFHCRQEVE